MNTVRLMKQSSHNEHNWGTQSLKFTEREVVNTRKRAILYSKSIPRPTVQVIRIE